jgi:hypothetical protein
LQKLLEEGGTLLAKSFADNEALKRVSHVTLALILKELEEERQALHKLRMESDLKDKIISNQVRNILKVNIKLLGC